jgi:hypothetical protein
MSYPLPPSCKGVDLSTYTPAELKLSIDWIEKAIAPQSLPFPLYGEGLENYQLWRDEVRKMRLQLGNI